MNTQSKPFKLFNTLPETITLCDRNACIMNILTENNLDLSPENFFFPFYCKEIVQIVKFSISWDQPVSLGVGVVQTKQVDKVFSPWGRQGAKTSIAISRYCLSTIFIQILQCLRYHIRYCLSTIFNQIMQFSLY